MIRLHSNNTNIQGKVQLESSKSVSNRILIIKALSNQDFKIDNISNADDTVIMNSIIKNYKKKY